MSIADVVAMLSAVAAAVSAYFAFQATKQARLQITAADRSVEAAVFLEIQEKWNLIYNDYRKLLKQPFDSAAVIKANPHFADYAMSDDWKAMRPVFAFHEFLGACLDAGLLKEDTLFSLVAVNPSLWEKYALLIKYFRGEQPELYRAWESLIRRKRAHSTARLWSEAISTPPATGTDASA